MYFDQFPTFLYPYQINGKTVYKLVTDVTTNVRVRTAILSNVTLYDQYDVVDGETPEIIAEKVYGSPYYHWVVMLCNENFDYINDFPLPQQELSQYVTNKYGAGNEYNTHHYVDRNGYVVNSNAEGAASVSNFYYEISVNESKRRIKLISPSLLNTILQNFQDII